MGGRSQVNQSDSVVRCFSGAHTSYIQCRVNVYRRVCVCVDSLHSWLSTGSSEKERSSMTRLVKINVMMRTCYLYHERELEEDSKITDDGVNRQRVPNFEKCVQ